MRRFFHYCYNLWALLWFVLLMLIVLPLSLLASLAGKVKGGNIIYRICNGWAIAWYNLIGIRHKELYEAPLDRSRQYIFVANHISYMDIPCIVRCIHQPVRVLGKSDMVKYPVFGLIYKMAAILVDRKNTAQRAKSVRILKAALRKGISIFLFPEGTFNETPAPLKDFFDGAFRIAIETQTPIQPVLFTDTLERMHYSGFLTLTPGKCRTVFLDTIEVQGYTMAQLKELKQQVHAAMDAGMRRYHTYPTPVRTTETSVS
jgi:1-acyl-sn-glycerol-3-phosphate acyltransferase